MLLEDLHSYELSSDGKEVTLRGVSSEGGPADVTLSFAAATKALEAILCTPGQQQPTDGEQVQTLRPPLRLVGMNTAKGANGLVLLQLHTPAGKVSFAAPPDALPTMIERLQLLMASTRQLN